MNFTAKDVAALREKTGCGMMDCKKALTETNGDMEKAILYLREKGLAAAAKKASRIAAEGVVYAYTDDKTGVLIEVNSETDFVAKNSEFMEFVKSCAETVAEQNPADVDALLKLTPAGSDRSVEQLLQEKIQVIGENIKIRRFVRVEGIVSTYIHGGGRIGVLAEFDADPSVAQTDAFKSFAKDICMQCAASFPLYLDREAVPAEVVEQEKKILTEQVLNEGKPANVAEKIVEGRISKYYKDFCLLEQLFIKDTSISVAKYVENTAKELNSNIKIKAFYRYEKGEGLQKREDNFAEEVAGMVK